MINTVTITGADDSIHPQDLLDLQNEFPFVEWAILFSTKRTGTPRYPSGHWIDSLFDLSDKFLGLSAHLCGDYARAILLGDDSFLQLTKSKFNRVQINHNFAKSPMEFNKLYDVIMDWPEFDFIMQKNKANGIACHYIEKQLFGNVNFLYDSSGGRGTKIDSLGLPFNHNYTGYSGGLNPENVEAEMLRINKFVEDTNVWIDMETGVRSDDDKLFDLKKVRTVLEIADKYIWETSD